MENNIGALWVKESQKGDFFTGKITTDNGEEIKIVIFKNNYKNKESQPDFTIYKAREQGNKTEEDKKYEQEEREAIQNEQNYTYSNDELPF